MRKKEEINISLLIDTLSVQTVSNGDSNMLTYIRQYVHSLGLSCTSDAYGNIYVTKGKGPYVAFVAHTDTVHTIVSDCRVHKHGDTLFAFNGVSGRQYGIGGDDKVGVFCNLQALSDFKNVKLAFFRNEEIGCLGSGNAILSFFDDCNFVIQFDRRGNSDLITSVGGADLCSTEFKTATKPFFDKIGYKETSGLSTDVATLKRRGLAVSAVNLSCGYHDPHMNTEIVKISEVDRIYKTIKRIVYVYGDTKFPHVYVAPVYTPAPHSSYSSYAEAEEYSDFYAGSRTATYSMYKSSAPFTKFETLHKDLPKSYKYIGPMRALEVEDSKCPMCNADKDSIYFLPNEVNFYCTACNDYITNPRNLFKKLNVEDKKTKFVFSWPNNEWIKEQDAVWSLDYYTYLLK